MAILKMKDIKNMNEKDKEEKLKELRLELVKKSITANRTSKIRAKEIKKAIARLLTDKINKNLQGGKTL